MLFLYRLPYCLKDLDKVKQNFFFGRDITMKILIAILTVQGVQRPVIATIVLMVYGDETHRALSVKGEGHRYSNCCLNSLWARNENRESYRVSPLIIVVVLKYNGREAQTTPLL